MNRNGPTTTPADLRQYAQNFRRPESQACERSFMPLETFVGFISAWIGRIGFRVEDRPPGALNFSGFVSFGAGAASSSASLLDLGLVDLNEEEMSLFHTVMERFLHGRGWVHIAERSKRRKVEGELQAWVAINVFGLLFSCKRVTVASVS